MNEKQKLQLIKQIDNQIKILDSLIKQMRRLELSGTHTIQGIVRARSACIHSLGLAQLIDAEPMKPLVMPERFEPHIRSHQEWYAEHVKQIWTVGDAIVFLTAHQRYWPHLSHIVAIQNCGAMTDGPDVDIHFKLLEQAANQLETVNDV